jgi:cytochrome b subunit of formate dehydrogenase
LIYWVRRIYLWLIVVLIGSMALHNIIDFLSKARRQKPSVMGGQPPAEKERMPRMVRWQHGLVMVSFPLLAYTGFALKYPESWWASPLLRWESEIALRGLLHRISAIVLLAALIWHLAHLALSPQFRKRLSGLKPAIRDLWDFLSLQRYNLGLMQERPRFEKFSYIEKAEYWAFVWGMVIMTITGAILWFENITLRYIPWLADLATTVHFYEAVLATLAVLVWHFYWVIFDPDVYPIDMSWWHGRSPATRAAERLLEERMEPLAETEASDEGDHHAP